MEPLALTIHIIIGMLRQLAKNLDGIVEERIEEHNLEWSDVSSSDEESIIDVEEEDVERTDDYTAFFNTVRDEVKGVLMKNIADLEEQLPPEGREMIITDKDEEDAAEEDREGVLVVAPKSLTSSDFCMATVISVLDMVDEQIDSIFKKYLEQLDPSEMLPGARRPSR